MLGKELSGSLSEKFKQECGFTGLDGISGNLNAAFPDGLDSDVI